MTKYGWEDRLEKTIDWVEELAEKTKGSKLGQIYNLLAPHDPPRPECEHSIICNLARSCGRRTCPAYTVQVDYYVRKIK